MVVMTQPGVFPEPEHASPLMDGRWLVGPAPCRLRYLPLGEDGETVMVYGHRLDIGDLRVALIHGGCYWDGHGDDEPLPLQETWATELVTCPKHRRWQRWVVRPVEWVRHQVFRALWKLWWSRDPLRQWWRPAWLRWTQERWRGFVHCGYCEWVAVTGDPYWTWDTHGGPVDANRGKPGYFPVTVMELET